MRLMKTAIRVISMGTAQARRQRFSDDARGAEVEWSYFDALRLPEAPLRYDEPAALVHTGRPLRAGEIGCYASHHSVWTGFLKSGHDQLIVFEDDVVVDWGAIRVLCERDLAADGIHILRLFATHPTRSTIARYKLFSDHSHLMRLQGHCYGTQAYVLTRQGAAALVKSCARLSMPVDWAMSRYWDYGVDNYAVFPFPVLERLGPSTIAQAAHGGAGQPGMPSVPSVPSVPNGSRIAWRLRERVSRAWADARRVRRPFGLPSDTASAMFTPPEALRY